MQPAIAEQYAAPDGRTAALLCLRGARSHTISLLRPGAKPDTIRLTDPDAARTVVGVVRLKLAVDGFRITEPPDRSR